MRSWILASLLLVSCGEAVLDTLHAEVLAIESVDRLHGPSAGGVRVTVKGRAFCSAPVVTFGDAVAADADVVARDVLLVTSPAQPIGDAELRITCPDGQSVAYEHPFRYFASAVALATGLEAPQVSPIAFADFDGDGLDDMLALFAAELRFVAYRNEGLNRFAEAPLFTVPFGEVNLSDNNLVDTRDRDGDGRADVLFMASRRDASAVEIVLVESGDRFADVERVELPSAGPGFGIRALAAADFDGDGALDYAVLEDAEGRGVLRIYLNLWDGTFAPFDAGEGYFDPSPAYRRGDFDENGAEDLMFVVRGSGSRMTHVMGTVGGTPVATEARSPDLVLPFDFDGDLWPDLIATEVDDKLHVQRGIAAGVFADIEVFDCHGPCRSTRLALSPRLDLDENGVSDHVLQHAEGFRWVELESERSVELGAGVFAGVARMQHGLQPAMIGQDGSVLSARYYAGRALDPDGATFSDVAPLAAARSWFCSGDAGGRHVVFGPQRSDGALVVRERGEGALFGEPRALQLTGDVAVLEQVGLAICEPARFGDDLGGFVLSTAGETTAVVIRFRRDGDVQVVAMEEDRPWLLAGVARRPGDGSASALVRVSEGHVDVFRLEGGGFARTASGYSAAAAASPMTVPWVGHLDDDDVIDLVHGGHDLRVSLGRAGAGGELELEAASVAGLEGVLIGSNEVADIDGDGDWDFVVHSTNANKQVLLLENDGHAHFAVSTEVDRLLDMRFLGACDLDGDGERDLVFDIQDAVGYMLHGRGGAPHAPLDVVETAMGTLLHSGRRERCRDMDSDGLVDVVFDDFIAATQYVLYNRSR